MSCMFQSTRPHGARQFFNGMDGDDVLVSIHAPARGATEDEDAEGGENKFQSTRPHGARQQSANRY